MLTSHYTIVRREEGEMSWEPDITYYMKQMDGNLFECKLEITKIAEMTNCTLTLGFAPKYNNPHVFTPPTIIIDE